MQINIKKSVTTVCICMCYMCIVAGCGRISKELGTTNIATTESMTTVDSNVATEMISYEETIETINPSEELKFTSKQMSLLMVGDILLHTPVENAALQEDGTYDFTAIFQHTVEDIQAADLAIVNQEVIIGGEELGISGYPAFNAPYAVGDALVEAGFDVVCHGTNHALDKGRKGLLNCVNFWKEQYPETAVLGIHDSQESQDSIYVYERDGINMSHVRVFLLCITGIRHKHGIVMNTKFFRRLVERKI